MGERLPSPRELLIPVLYVLGLSFVFLAAYLFLGTAEPREPEIGPSPNPELSGR
jgi:hypothetical protein